VLRRLIGDVVERVEALQEAAPRERPRREVVLPERPREEWGLGEEGERPAPRPRAAPAPPRPDARRELVADLFSPSGLRRAFLLQEILGPPKALRDGDGPSPWTF
jgi:hypothetical protein